MILLKIPFYYMMTKDEEDDYEILEKWFEKNETRFSHAQYSDKDIAYSAWLEGRKHEKEKRMKNKLEQFLKWLEEEDLYPLLDHNDLVAALEEYEAEIETSSEKEVNVL